MFTFALWQGQLDDKCRQAKLQEGCLTVSLGDMDLPKGLERVDDDPTQARDTATGTLVDIACLPVDVNPKPPLPADKPGKAEVGTNFAVDVECETTGVTAPE